MVIDLKRKEPSQFEPWQNGLGLWIIINNSRKEAEYIPLFLGFDSKETCQYFCDKWNDLYEVNKKLKSENKRLEKIIEELNIELTEIKQSEEDNYNITDGLW